MSTNEKKLSVLGHIAELRKRLIRSVIAVVLTAILSFIFFEQIFNILTSPAPQDINLIYIEMTEMIGTIMRVCLISGIILAMPYLTYELIMFVSPALTGKEKRYVYLILPWIALMFAAGVAFAYFILIPRVTGFLLTFGSDIATPQIKIGNYVSIVSRLLLAVGLVFEMPVLTTFLAKIGIITPKWLADKRRTAIILAFILAVVLYELSIWLAKLVHKKEPAVDTSISSPESQP